MAEALSSSPTDTGEIIARMDALRDEKRQLGARIQQLDDEYGELEARLLSTMDQQGTQIAATSRVHAAISEQTVPTIRDWDAFLEHCRDSDRLYLLQRRVSTGPWRELLDAGELVPGTEPYTKRSIHLRKR